MSIHKLSKSETEALLTELADNRNCPNGCECVFCREFVLGVESGKHDVLIEISRAVGEMKRRLRA